MSQENVEIVKAVIDAYNRENWDAVFRDIAPDSELDMSRAVGPTQGVFKADQIRRVLVEFRETRLASTPMSSSKPMISWWCP